MLTLALVHQGAPVRGAWPCRSIRMTQAKTRDPIYRRRRFEAEIIELCVRWYITYPGELSGSGGHDGRARDQAVPHDDPALGDSLRPRVREAVESLVPEGELLLESGRDVHPSGGQMAVPLSCR